MATLSILGLYNYDQTIFDGLTLPGLADITSEAEKVADPWVPDKNDFIAYLCMQLAELSLVYASGPIMSTMITVWSAAHRYEWVQLYNTMLYKYNPIWNKDGTVTETRQLKGSDNRKPNLQTVDDFSVYDMETEHTGDVKNNVTGYDANTYSPNTQTEQDTKDTQNGRTQSSRVETGSDNRDISESETVTRTESGNIGVTMTQEMIRQQREIVKFNLYEYITQEFKNQFCIMVY